MSQLRQENVFMRFIYIYIHALMAEPPDFIFNSKLIASKPGRMLDQHALTLSST